MNTTHPALGWHLTLRLDDGRNLAPGIGERRKIAAAVLAAGARRGLFAFSVPDTHLHLATTRGRAEAGQLAHAVECSLHYALSLGGPFAPARIRPIEDQAHLGNVLPYILGNGHKHQNELDPGCEGSSLPDALGLRLTGRYTISRLRRLLPRLSRRALLAHLPVADLHAGDDPALLADAAAASLALPELRGRGAHHRVAQRAAVHIALRLGLRPARITELLGLSIRTVCRHMQEKPDSAVMSATRLQMGLMESLGARDLESRAYYA